MGGTKRNRKYRKRQILKRIRHTRGNQIYINDQTVKRSKVSFGGEHPIVNNIPICIYSHSTVFDVLEIQFEYLSKLFNNEEQKIYLFADKNYDKHTKLKYETILYDDNITYNRRILTCIEKIICEYFIISHESDILFKYNKDIIFKISEIMKQNNIDSVELKQQPNCINKIKVTNELSLTDVTEKDYTFNVQPRLWKRTSSLKFFGSIPNVTYKSIEIGVTQNYIEQNFKTYSLCNTRPVRSLRKFIQIPDYVYIHITSQGGFIKQDMTNVDKFIIDEYNNIHKKYIEKSNRGEKEYILV